MRYGFIFKAISFLAVIAFIFFAGFISGGGFATGLVEESVLQQVDGCMPAQGIDELRPCLLGDAAVQP